jgi:predicted AAA+ superfamily ATPase
MATINNIASVTIDELRKLIPAIGQSITPVIQSEPGCGKTSLLKMIKEDLGDAYDYIYVDCPVKDMSDIAMTIPNHASKSLETYVGSLFKLDSPKPKVILLDEFMKSPKLLQVIFIYSFATIFVLRLHLKVESNLDYLFEQELLLI